LIATVFALTVDLVEAADVVVVVVVAAVPVNSRKLPIPLLAIVLAFAPEVGAVLFAAL
jgi:hypothetical protein